MEHVVLYTSGNAFLKPFGERHFHEELMAANHILSYIQYHISIVLQIR